MPKRWKRFENNAKRKKRNIKTLKGSEEFLSRRAPRGYFTDNLSMEDQSIKEAGSPRLRRWVKVIDRFINLITDYETIEYLTTKKIEIETELNKRPDGVL